MPPSDHGHATHRLDIARVQDVLDDAGDQSTIVVSGHVWDRMIEAGRGDSPIRASSLESVALDGAASRAASDGPSGPVVAVGGGTAIDTAKFIADSLDRSLILVPASTSTLAPFVTEIAHRHRRELRPTMTHPADRIVIDPDLLAGTPPSINQLGAAELIAGLVAISDWHLAASPTVPYVESVAEQAQDLLERLADIAPALGMLSTSSCVDHAADRRTIVRLAELLSEAGALVEHSGHRRMFEGSEHLFVEAVEHRLGTHTHRHGQLVALGSVIMAELQQSDVERCVELLTACGVSAHPMTLGLDEDVFNGLLRHTVRYAIGEQRATSILNQRQIDRPTAAAMWQASWGLPR